MVAIDYMTHLFKECGHVFKPYSDAQIDQGLWFLIGGCSCDHPRLLNDATIPWLPRQECVHSMFRLFEFFAMRCTPHLSHLDEQPANPLNSICYMFWDILSVREPLDEPDSVQLDEALLGMMSEILLLPSDACCESALHGLGHWQRNYPEKVDEIVSSFLSREANLRPALREYALRAQHGAVQ
jgi:hypothetical protein